MRMKGVVTGGGERRGFWEAGSDLKSSYKGIFPLGNLL